MKGKLVALLLAVAVPFAVRADPSSDTAKAEMAKIAQMAGKWKGSGYIDLPTGRHESLSEETIEMRVDGRAILIEGLHRDVKSGEVNHHALAIIAWDDYQKQYRFMSALAAGRTGYFPARLEGKKFIWSIPIPNGPTSRFTISLDDPDKWKEVGEQSRDGGMTWVKFFEMNLERVK
jgi:hypothetical protein